MITAPPFLHMTDEWNRRYRLYHVAEIRRNGVALAICDMVDMGRVVKGPPLRRFRRLDKLVKAYYKGLYTERSPKAIPLGGIDG